MEVISRKEALSLGKTHYYTGIPCKHGHITKRLVSNWTCCECINERGRNVDKTKKAEWDKGYRDRHPNKLKESKKRYYLQNKDIINTKTTEYTRNKRKTDTLFRLTCVMRSRLSNALKRRGYDKTSITADTLGCSWEDLKIHLESQFKDGMTWENHGKTTWHIDHIIPLASASNSEEMCKLNHYTNLQPLWAKDNMSKGNKILKDNN